MLFCAALFKLNVVEEIIYSSTSVNFFRAFEVIHVLIKAIILQCNPTDVRTNGHKGRRFI